MNTDQKYDPEDIEYLLSNKTFDELYPEEKEFVLRHMDSRSEYEQMRKIVLELHEPEVDDLELSGTDRMRDDLIAMHEKRHARPSFFIWLNSLFVGLSIDRPLYRVPAFQLAIVASIILAGFFIVNTSETSDIMATVPEMKKERIVESTQEIEFDKEESTEELQNETVRIVEEENQAIVQSAEQTTTLRSTSLEEVAKEEKASIGEVNSEDEPNMVYQTDNSDNHDLEEIVVTDFTVVIAEEELAEYSDVVTNNEKVEADMATPSITPTVENEVGTFSDDATTTSNMVVGDQETAFEMASFTVAAPTEELIDILFTSW